MTATSKTPLLDTINSPADLRKLQIKDLRQLADELRAETIDAVSITGGSVSGITDLAVADGGTGAWSN